MHKQLFPLGRVVITATAQAVIPPALVSISIARHESGDDGDLDAEDKQINKDALKHGGRIFSAYETPQKKKFWIITEADRSVTTVLLPEDMKLFIDAMAAQFEAGLQLAKSEGKAATNAVLRDIDSFVAEAMTYFPKETFDKNDFYDKIPSYE